jgi:hypothetical protein
MTGGTFEVTFYPQYADPGVAGREAVLRVRCPVLAVCRRPQELNVRRAGGWFECDRGALVANDARVPEYGRTLGRGLFGPDPNQLSEVGRLFREALASTPPDGSLHVLLSLEEPSLRGLGWERLCGPVEAATADGWDHLGLNQRTPLAVYVAGATDRRFPPVGFADFRVLVVVAAPDGAAEAPPFDAGAAREAILRGLAGTPGGTGVRCDVLARGPEAQGPPTLAALLDRLSRGGHTILHLVCHGTFPRAANDFCLYLEKEDGSADRVPGQLLRLELQRLGSLRKVPYLTFLCACHSASARAAHDQFAQELVRSLGMPAAVGMADAVTPETAGVLAGTFYHRLRTHGLPDLALAEARAGLSRRFDVLVPVLVSQLGARPLFDPSIDNPPVDAEAIAAGLDRLARELERRAPALLNQDAFRRSAEAVRTLAPDAPAWREAVTELNDLADEVVEVSFNRLAAGQAPPPYDDRCPFPGLSPFRPADREFFFGRDDLVDRLAGRLSEHNVLAVVGPSGSGKSSLVLAGLLPRLLDQRPELARAYLTPGEDPLGELDRALGSHPRLDLLIVDQFEELFTLCRDAEARRRFADRLVELSHTLRVVLTLRDDFVKDCAGLASLGPLLQARQEAVPPMTPPELLLAIDGQVRQVRLRFEAGLNGQVVDEVAGEPGAMPLLQHALQALWKRRHGRWLLVSEYRRIGGVRKAIAETAEGVYSDLSPASQARLRRMFVRLTRLGDDPLDGGAPRDTRQRLKLDDLTPDGEGPEETRRLVKVLADDGARLLVSGRQPHTGEEVVEVAHEALIQHWPRLKAWLDEDRPDLRLLASVREASLGWQGQKADESRLVHRGPRLLEAQRLKTHPRLSLGRTEAEYLAACAALGDRERRDKERRQRQLVLSLGLAVGLLAASLLAGALAFLSYRSWLSAEAQAAADRRANSWSRYALQAKVAASDLLSGNLSRMKAVLDEGDKNLDRPPDGDRPPDDPRGFEWYYLRQTLRRPTASLGALDLKATGLAYEPTDRLLAAVSDWGELRIWAVDDLAQRYSRVLPGPAGAWSVAFAADGRLAVVSPDRVRILDRSSWSVVAERAAGNRAPLHEVLFGLGMPGDQVAALGSTPADRDRGTQAGEALHVWDLAASPEPLKYPAPTGRSFVAFAPSPDRTGWSALDGKWEVHRIKPAAGRLEGESTPLPGAPDPRGHFLLPQFAAFNGDGTRLAVIDPPSRLLMLFQVDSDRPPRALAEPPGWKGTDSPFAVAWDRKGGRLVVGVSHRDGEGISYRAEWRDAQGKAVASEALPEANTLFPRLCGGDYDGSGLKLAWAGLSGKVYTQRGPPSEVIERTFDLKGASCAGLAFDDPCRTVLVVSNSEAIRYNLEDLAEGRGPLVSWRKVALDLVPTLAMSQPVKHWEIDVEFWRGEPPTEQEKQKAKEKADVVEAALSADAARLALRLRDGRVLLVDPVSGKVLSTLSGLASPPVTMAFLPRSERLLLVCQDGALRSWAGDGPTEVAQGFPSPTRLSVARDGAHAAVVSGGKVALLTTQDFSTVKTLDPPSGAARCAHLAFSPDGRFLTSLWDAPGDGGPPGEASVVLVWPVAGGTDPVLRREVPRPLAVKASAAHPEGNRLVTAERLGRPTFWSLGPRGVSDWPIQDLISLDTTPLIDRLQFSPDGSVLVAARLGSISFWRAAARPSP